MGTQTAIKLFVTSFDEATAVFGSQETWTIDILGYGRG